MCESSQLRRWQEIRIRQPPPHSLLDKTTKNLTDFEGKAARQAWISLTWKAVTSFVVTSFLVQQWLIVAWLRWESVLRISRDGDDLGNFF